MPNFARKLSAQSIGERTKPCRSHLGNVLIREHSGALALLVTVHTCAQSLYWIDPVNRPIGMHGYVKSIFFANIVATS